ncbi:MAG TPA: methyltransferase regulatory domain-containing protein [Vicinamibacterales bacterium]
MTTSSYDQLPYISVAFPQTHPDRLAAIARIFALTTPDVASCRVLELGCASGGNLIPMAFNLPGSEFVGIDLSERQVVEAQSAIAELGLRNIRIEQASILDIGDDWGAFDYIICHGVFSWVDAAVQDHILRISARNLSPDGIAYVSYNTYPGWHLREMVRHMMQYHAGQFSEPREQVAQARALLTFLATASKESGPYNQLLATEAERAARAPDSYLYHEHLERSNTPIYFHQFIERAGRVGLQFLSEADVSEMLTSQLPAAVAGTLERISADLLHLEQYMDFVRNRQFRQTLLCHDARRPRRALHPDALDGLKLSSAAVCDAAPQDLDREGPVLFTNGSKRAQIASPATKAAMTVLMEHWPCAIDLARLCDLSMQRAGGSPSTASSEEARASMMEDLFGGVMYGLIEAHTQAPRCTNRPSDAPRAHPIAAFQARSSNVVVNAHHTMIQLDALALEILKLADGHRTRADMLDVLIEWFKAGRMQLEEDGRSLTDLHSARAMLADRLDKGIATLTRSALLEK